VHSRQEKRNCPHIYHGARSIARVALLGAAKVAARFGYRLIRLPLQLVDDLVLPRALGADDPLRLAFDRVLIGCDRIAVRLLDDPTAVRRAAELCERSAATDLSIARYHRRLQQEADARLARHRALFREKQLRDCLSQRNNTFEHDP
jgi:hypothetical protein